MRLFCFLTAGELCSSAGLLFPGGSIAVMVHAPVKVITVEREFGSRGGEFAHDLARHLGWR